MLRHFFKMRRYFFDYFKNACIKQSSFDDYLLWMLIKAIFHFTSIIISILSSTYHKKRKKIRLCVVIISALHLVHLSIFIIFIAIHCKKLIR